MKDANDDAALPVLGDVPIEELLESEDWRLSAAARRVLQSLEPASYAAHGSSPEVPEQPLGGRRLDVALRSPSTPDI